MTLQAARKKYAIVSIRPDLSDPPIDGANALIQAAGLNLGNLVFTSAVWNAFDGEKTRVNFSFDADALNEAYDAVIIPAANWLNPDLDFGDFGDRIGGLKIPVVMVGLGAQAPGYDKDIRLQDSVLKVIRNVHDRSQSIAMRGEHSAELMRRLGFSQVVVTGCPSLYESDRPIAPPPAEIGRDRLLLHSTRYSARHVDSVRRASIHRSIFRLAYAEDIDLLLQSEPEEIEMALGYEPGFATDAGVIDLMLRLYKAPGWGSLQSYIRRRTKAFLTVAEWEAAMAPYHFVIGTRLHGTIAALNAGKPAVLIHHDSRTREVAEFACIPSLDAEDHTFTMDHVREAAQSADIAAYEKRRADNRRVFAAFLKANDLVAA